MYEYKKILFIDMIAAMFFSLLITNMIIETPACANTNFGCSFFDLYQIGFMVLWAILFSILFLTFVIMLGNFPVEKNECIICHKEIDEALWIRTEIASFHIDCWKKKLEEVDDL